MGQNFGGVYLGSIHILNGKIKRSLVNFVGLVKTVTEMSAGCLWMMKSYHVCMS